MIYVGVRVIVNFGILSILLYLLLDQVSKNDINRIKMPIKLLFNRHF